MATFAYERLLDWHKNHDGQTIASIIGSNGDALDDALLNLAKRRRVHNAPIGVWRRELVCYAAVAIEQATIDVEMLLRRDEQSVLAEQARGLAYSIAAFVSDASAADEKVLARDPDFHDLRPSRMIITGETEYIRYAGEYLIGLLVDYADARPKIRAVDAMAHRYRDALRNWWKMTTGEQVGKTPSDLLVSIALILWKQLDLPVPEKTEIVGGEAVWMEGRLKA